MTTTLIAPSGPRFTGATIEEAVKAAGLRAAGGTAYVPSLTLSMDDHYCLVGAGITSVTVGEPPAEEVATLDATQSITSPAP